MTNVKDAMQMLCVTAKQARGRRRAGHVWPAHAVEVPAADFSDEQIQQLLNDPLLVVQAFEQHPEALLDDDLEDDDLNAPGSSSPEVSEPKKPQEPEKVPDNTTTDDKGQGETGAAKDGGDAKTSSKKATK